jgi:amicyanin
MVIAKGGGPIAKQVLPWCCLGCPWHRPRRAKTSFPGLKNAARREFPRAEFSLLGVNLGQCRKQPNKKMEEPNQMMNKLRSTAAQFSPGRAVVGAMLAGSAIGAFVAGAVAAPEAAEVKIENLTFSPVELTVPVGTTVTWVNKDEVPHNVVDKNKAFRSKLFETDGSFSFTFDNAGTYDYVCGVHPQMIGKIIVK